MFLECQINLMADEPPHSKILILNVPRYRRGLRKAAALPAKTDEKAPKRLRRRPRSIALLVRILRVFGYKFVTVSEALEASAGKFACLTFDGADRDIVKEVLPVLDARGVPATVFVSTKEVASKPLRPARPVMPPSAKTPAALSWKHLRQLTTCGWEIGSLAHEYVNLTEKSSMVQKQLIARSREIIAKRIGLPPKVFAYPHGAYDATTVSCVRDSGFSAAVTLRTGSNDKSAGRYQLRRLTLSGSRVRDFVVILKDVLTVHTKTPETRANKSEPAAAQSNEPQSISAQL